jgi:porin
MRMKFPRMDARVGRTGTRSCFVSDPKRATRRISGWLRFLLPAILVVAMRCAAAEDLSALKAQLVHDGLTPSLQYDGDAFGDLAGGDRRGATGTGNLHVQLAIDGGQSLNVPGLSGWVDLLWIHGGQPSKLAGDAQGVSNIAAPPAVRLYEAWLEYNFPGDRFSVLAGRYDLNTEFYHLSTASLFLNSSFGIGPEFGQSGFAGPSIFPDTSLGARFALKPAPNIVWRTAVLDGTPFNPQNGSPGPFNAGGGLLFVSELAILTRPTDGAAAPATRFRIGRNANLPLYDGKIAVGAWYYTARFNDLGAVTSAGTPVSRRGSDGAYVIMDHTLLRGADASKQRLAGFLQLGAADQQVNRFGVYIGAGLVATGALPGRPDDELGLAAAMARNGSHYLAGQIIAGQPVDAAETAIELSYLSQATSWLAVQPDAQYVLHPNTNPRVRNATVVQLELEMKF